MLDPSTGTIQDFLRLGVIWQLQGRIPADVPKAFHRFPRGTCVTLFDRFGFQEPSGNTANGIAFDIPWKPTGKTKA